MPHLLSPVAGLLALLTVAAPLILHLWRPPARTVRLGSLRFLQNLTPRQRNLRWRERALLVLRLGLLTLLALLLARPHWRRLNSPVSRQRWVLLSPDALPFSGEPLVRFRALRAAGYEAHGLAPGLPIAGPAPENTRAAEAPPPDLWSLLREADARLPAGSALAVFAPGRLAALRGERPTLTRCRVEWIEAPAPANDESRSAWLETFIFHPDSRELRARIAISDPAGTRSVSLNLPATPARSLHPVSGSDASLEILPPAAEGENGGFSARLVSAGATLPPDSWTLARVENPLRVLVFSNPDRAGDARSIEAAARAATESVGRGLVLTRLTAETNPTMSSPAPDWMFWLDAAPVPAALVQAAANRGSNLFSAGGETLSPAALTADTAYASWIVASPAAPGAEALAAAPVRLWQRPTFLPATHDGSTATLWTDGAGDPLLSVTPVGRGWHWRLHGRFDPAWDNLAASTALPATLSAWFSEQTASPAAAHDRRLADPGQSRPAEAPGNAPDPGPPPIAADAGDPGTDLHGWCWGLAILLFGVERAWSHRRRRTSPEFPTAASPASPPPLAAAASRA